MPFKYKCAFIAEKVSPFGDRAKSLYVTRKKDESKARLRMMKTDYKLSRPRGSPNKNENNFQPGRKNNDDLDSMTRGAGCVVTIKKKKIKIKAR